MLELLTEKSGLCNYIMLKRFYFRMNIGFTPDDVVRLCESIARGDNLKVVTSTHNSNIHCLPDENADSDTFNFRSPLKLFRKRRNQRPARSCLQMLDKVEVSVTRSDKVEVQGLGDRSVVLVALVVDEYGKQVQTFTEFDEMAPETIDRTCDVLFARMPTRLPSLQAARSHTRDCECGDGYAVKASETAFVADILQGLPWEKRKILHKEMQPLLPRLHTQDIQTALAIVDTPPISEARRQIKRNLIAFLAKELRLGVEHST